MRGEAELACPLSHTCWSTPRDYCAYCLGGDNLRCACWDASGPRGDGAACSVFEGGDAIHAGTCQAGSCALKPVP